MTISTPPPGELRRTVAAFADPQVKMVGGPNLCPPDAPFLEHVFALVHSTWLAFFSSCARYASVRENSAFQVKSELILCNLIARRDAMVELGGFNEALYPNEENALMDELQKRGGKLLYDPALMVHRRPRNNFVRAFAKMLLNYGRGRAEQFRLHPTLGSAPNFVPPLFCVYLFVLLYGFLLGALGEAGLLPVAVNSTVVLWVGSPGPNRAADAARRNCAEHMRHAVDRPHTHSICGAGFMAWIVYHVETARNSGARPPVDLENVQF